MNRGIQLGILIVVSAVCLSHAQTQTPQRGTPAVMNGFVGRVAPLDTSRYSIGRMMFEAGSHNATLHAHYAGQLVFAESGHGRFQIQNQPVRELAPGDSAFIPGGVMHWHGAVPNESFTMLMVIMGASNATQGEPVTNDVYAGKKK
jgi:quercetin dioxygenase-like cupin family protein